MGYCPVFATSGPKHMMAVAGSSPATMININWDNPEHRRCIAACIVNGVYVLESEDKSGQRAAAAGDELAPAWWESFHFRLVEPPLKCDCECVSCKQGWFTFMGHHRRWSIYGAILEYAPPAGTPRHRSAPRYVVAFRGTMPRHQSFHGDMHLNLKILVNRQHLCDRFRDARTRVGSLLDSASAGATVWLAGHSLGASIALDVGRDVMAKRGRSLPAFLFNPPQVSLSAGMLPAPLRKAARSVVRPVSSAAKAALGVTVRRHHEQEMEALFDRLAPWVPELYVHERDPICRGFIDYFEQREKMLGSWLRPVAEVAMKLSLRDMLISIHADTESGDDKRVRPHLLPSARLWKNSSYHDAHGLEQWWKPNRELRLSSRRYSRHGAERELFYD